MEGRRVWTLTHHLALRHPGASRTNRVHPHLLRSHHPGDDGVDRLEMARVGRHGHLNLPRLTDHLVTRVEPSLHLKNTKSSYLHTVREQKTLTSTGATVRVPRWYRTSPTLNELRDSLRISVAIKPVRV